MNSRCQTCPSKFTRWAQRVEPVVRAMDIEAPQLGAVTFFEITTAMAFLAFQERNVDLAVLETGLGGRLDSTNVCMPIATAITSIGIDHVAVLGDTEEKIAAEKAGIIKADNSLRREPGEKLATGNFTGFTPEVSQYAQQSNAFPIPVVLGRMHEGARRVIEQIARERRAPVIAADRDFTWTYTPVPESLTGVFSCGRYKDIQLNLPGAHQAGNAAVALQLATILNQRGFNITESALRRALGTIHIPGRIDVVCQSPMTIIDAAHNPDSISQLAAAVKRLNLPRENCVLVFACADDKDASEMFKLLYDYFGTWLFTRFSNNPRSCNPNRLKEIFNQRQEILQGQGSAQNDTVEVYERSADAIISAQNKTNRRLICIAGSFYLASEAYQALQ